MSNTAENGVSPFKELEQKVAKFKETIRLLSLLGEPTINSLDPDTDEELDMDYAASFPIDEKRTLSVHWEQYSNRHESETDSKYDVTIVEPIDQDGEEIYIRQNFYLVKENGQERIEYYVDLAGEKQYYYPYRNLPTHIGEAFYPRFRNQNTEAKTKSSEMLKALTAIPHDKYNVATPISKFLY